MDEVDFKMFEDTVNISTLKQDHQLTIIPPFDSPYHPVLVYSAVMSHDCTLVNSGHFVKIQVASHVSHISIIAYFLVLPFVHVYRSNTASYWWVCRVWKHMQASAWFVCSRRWKLVSNKWKMSGTVLC